jgi:hypothetical protein
MGSIMPAGRGRRANKPTQAGPRNQDHIDAQDDLRNAPAGAADYQTDLSAARDRNAALGDSTGNARRASGASGRNVDESTVAGARQAQDESRGNRETRDLKKRF